MPLHNPRPLFMFPSVALTALAAATVLTLAGCGGGDAGAKAGAGAGGMPPPPQVGVFTVQPGAVALPTELPGRLEAWRVAQVRARVAGIVQKRQFTEGGTVKANEPLFTLDADAFRAALASAEASQARAEAALAQANAQLERNRPLAEGKAISAQEWLATQTTAKAAVADVAAAKAAVQAARVNLDYTAIKSPIAGRIGRAQVSEGALVGPTDATALAVVQQTHPLYVNFTQSAAEALRLRRAFDGGQLKRAAAGAAAEVRVVLDDGSEYPLPGKLLFADPTVDAATGQVSLRAELPNPNGVLLPGLFVKVRVTQAVSEQAIRLPQQAVTRETSGDTVLVVGEGNKPMKRPIQIAGAMGADWVVTGGLKAGERVIVDGFQKMFVPGAPVTPVPWAPAAAKPAAGPGGASGAGGAATAAPAAASATAAASR
ncbi:efflux RND transporter periplasmic adaptor subunit [Aquabacterium sp. OR-4]|uniref:efflux RND transporter periplasmic adaptor subunit n=1 Tax=Aquabacterium sp. OR-4 TaxID=2978127 RepID=UPI0028C99CB9|nr:efflux RND transporter periplasmic adaptor subunit [Aquabacterium sp. OR-4]MDT7834295.1 efflux RND transporter periplasmic adaptor subunit [Aquabacterium sp. OR-4]